jgi:hypothetical protein
MAFLRRLFGRQAVIADVRDRMRVDGRRGNHVRWHANRGLVAPGCEWCPDRPESGGESPPIATRIAPIDTVYVDPTSRSESGDRPDIAPIAPIYGSLSERQRDRSTDSPDDAEPAHIAALRARGETTSVQQRAVYDALIARFDDVDTACRFLAALIRDAPPRMRGPKLHKHVWGVANELRKGRRSAPAFAPRALTRVIPYRPGDDLRLSEAELDALEQQLGVSRS